MKNTKLRLFSVLIVVIVALFLISCGTRSTIDGEIQVSNEETIKIGVILPLTGDVAALGESTKNAVQMAVEEINAEGGISGTMIEVVYEDGQCDGAAAATAANKLVSIDNVHYLVGGLCSSETLAAAPIIEAAGVVEISPCSSNPDVTTAGDYIFRVYPSDSFQGAYAAEYAYNTLGSRNVAVMNCLSDWCVGLADVFTATFEGLSGTVVEKQEFEQDATDMRTQLTKVKDADPDLVYMVAYTENTINALKQKSELGLMMPFLGGDAWDDPTIWENSVGYADGAMYVIPDAEAPEAFVAKMQSRFGIDTDVTLCAAQGYDIVNIFTWAIGSVGDDPASVKNALYTMPAYSGVSGTISFDENGDLIAASYLVKEVQDGVAVVVGKK